MELERAIIHYVLDHFDQTDQTLAKLQIALELIDGLSPWDAEKALKVMFGGVADA